MSAAFIMPTSGRRGRITAGNGRSPGTSLKKLRQRRGECRRRDTAQALSPRFKENFAELSCHASPSTYDCDKIIESARGNLPFRGVLRIRFLSGAVIGLAGGLAGCQSQDQNGNMTRRYFGLTTVTIPCAATGQTNFYSCIVSNVGLVAGSSALGLGYTRTRDITLPARGAIYLELRSPEQLEAFKSVINQSSNLAICIIESSRPKRLAGTKH